MNKIKSDLYEIIFEADTFRGKFFDLAILVIILFSILLVMLESVESIERDYKNIFKYCEWAITVIFTIEYLLRVWIVKRSSTYIFSFYGVIDFLAVAPSYLALTMSGAHGLMVIRALRLLRVFRILKLNRYTKEGSIIIKAMKASRIKISVFLFTVSMLVVIIGTIMYLVEGRENGFTSIPKGIYWAIVTLTTVGYGDISPSTALGQLLASVVMIIGYAIIAVPTGIVTTELTRQDKLSKNKHTCTHCLCKEHNTEAKYCMHCGYKLDDE